MLFSSPMDMAGTSTGRTFGGPPVLGALGPLGLPGAALFCDVGAAGCRLAGTAYVSSAPPQQQIILPAGFPHTTVALWVADPVDRIGRGAFFF